MSVCARSVSVCLRSLSLPRSRCVCRRPRLFLDSVSIALFPRLCVRSLSRPVLDSLSIALSLSRLCARSLSLSRLCVDRSRSFWTTVCICSLSLSPCLPEQQLANLRQYLYFCTSKASTFVPVSTCMCFSLCLRILLCILDTDRCIDITIGSDTHTHTHTKSLRPKSLRPHTLVV